jgi:hypothetical protein
MKVNLDKYVKYGSICNMFHHYTTQILQEQERQRLNGYWRSCARCYLIGIAVMACSLIMLCVAMNSEEASKFSRGETMGINLLQVGLSFSVIALIVAHSRARSRIQGP